MDWTVSQAANEAYAQNFSMVAHQNVHSQNQDFPKNLAQQLVKNDFYWAAEQRESILKQWSAQFEK